MNSEKPLWTVEWDIGAQRDIKKLPKSIQLKIADTISETLSKNPYIGEKLKGRYKGLYKYRIGNYRIIYNIQIDRLVILILRVANRKDVYRLPL